MAFVPRTSAFHRITAIAGRRQTHAAFAWLHGNPKRIMDWQVAVVAIPAPPFGEAARGRWLADRFVEAGLCNVETDEIGNVLGFLQPPDFDAESTGPIVVVSAHLDTVFPADTPLKPALSNKDGIERLDAPGACDNAAGLAGLLAIANAFAQARVDLPAPLLFVGNVGEEGEGDLRGIRHLYNRGAIAGRIAAHIVLDGAGSDSAVTQALGSRRFQVAITGPGGHSFTDAGLPNPIAALSIALAALVRTPIPEEPRTTLSIGTIHGGTSVNSIPESALATLDFRSISTDELVRLEVALHRAVEDAVEFANSQAKNLNGAARTRLAFAISKIGDRPAAQLRDNSPLFEALRAVDRFLELKTVVRLGSTDANIPLALNVPALSLGAGGDGGGAHTQAEWYSSRDREIGLKRIVLLTLAMLEWAAEQ
jgi:acetylornithine deacetylase/succinyl-diaminopimelate desuccinylase-like protein